MKINWSHELVKAVALRYNVKRRFRIEFGGGFGYAERHGIWGDITKHMKPAVRWTHELVEIEAKKYEYRKDFIKGVRGGYKYALKNGILEEICSHMKINGHKHKRMIYEIKFPDKHMTYIGLTCNPKQRKSNHIKKSSNKFVRQLISNGEKYEFCFYNTWYGIKDIVIEEINMIESRETSGWKVLNINKGGGLGSSGRWTYELVLELAKECQGWYITKFSKMYGGAYGYARNNNFLDEVRQYMKPLPRKFTYKMVEGIAKNFTTISEFQKKDGGAYGYACRKGIHRKICSHMKIKK